MPKTTVIACSALFSHELGVASRVLEYVAKLPHDYTEAAFPKLASWAAHRGASPCPGWQMQLRTAKPGSLHRFPWPETPAREKYYRLHSLG